MRLAPPRVPPSCCTYRFQQFPITLFLVEGRKIHSLEKQLQIISHRVKGRRKEKRRKEKERQRSNENRLAERLRLPYISSVSLLKIGPSLSDVKGTPCAYSHLFSAARTRKLLPSVPFVGDAAGCFMAAISVGILSRSCTTFSSSILKPAWLYLCVCRAGRCCTRIASHKNRTRKEEATSASRNTATGWNSRIADRSW